MRRFEGTHSYVAADDLKVAVYAARRSQWMSKGNCSAVAVALAPGRSYSPFFTACRD